MRDTEQTDTFYAGLIARRLRILNRLSQPTCLDCGVKPGDRHQDYCRQWPRLLRLLERWQKELTR